MRIGWGELELNDTWVFKVPYYCDHFVTPKTQRSSPIVLCETKPMK